MTVAMWLGVMHHHVMIDQLTGQGQVQAIEHGLNARAVEMSAQIAGNASSDVE